MGVFLAGTTTGKTLTGRLGQAGWKMWRFSRMMTPMGIWLLAMMMIPELSTLREMNSLLTGATLLPLRLMRTSWWGRTTRGRTRVHLVEISDRANSKLTITLGMLASKMPIAILPIDKWGRNAGHLRLNHLLILSTQSHSLHLESNNSHAITPPNNNNLRLSLKYENINLRHRRRCLVRFLAQSWTCPCSRKVEGISSNNRYLRAVILPQLSVVSLSVLSKRSPSNTERWIASTMWISTI